MTWSFLQSRWVRIFATVLLLGALFFALDTHKLADAIFRIDPVWMAVGAALSLLFVLSRMLKWMVLASSNDLHAEGIAMFRCMLFALALGIVTPGRVGEAVAVMPFVPSSRGRAIFAYIYDRVGELCTVILFCIPAALQFIPAWGGLLALALAIGTLAVIFSMNSKGWHTWVAEKFARIIPGRLAEILKAPIRVPAGYWLLSVLTYVLAYASVAAFISGAEPNMNLGAFFVLPVVTLSNLVTITIGGLGVREGLAALVSPAAGLTPEVTAAAFFLSFFWTRLLPGLAGTAWTMARGHKF